MKYRIKKVIIMAALAKKATSNTKKSMRARTQALHESICARISAAGITPEQIEKDVYEAYLNVKKTRSTRRN